MDWTTSKREDAFVFEMLDPMSFTSRGLLEGVLIDGSTVTQGYYTNERISGQLELDDSNLIENSLIRITHTAGDWRNVLGTFYQASDKSSYSHGRYSGPLDLKSCINGIADDGLPGHWAINEGEWTKAATDNLLRQTMRPYRIESGANDRRVGSTTIYDVGETVLSILFDICSIGGNRLEAGSDGTMLITRYISPSEKTPVWVFSPNDGMVIGEIERTRNTYETAARSVVVGKSGDEEFFAQANVSSGSAASSSVRGRMVTTVHNESSLSSWVEAQSKADAYLADDSAESIEYAFQSRYVPLVAGNVVTLNLDCPHKCLVKNVDTDLQGMLLDITLKEV